MATQESPEMSEMLNSEHAQSVQELSDRTEDVQDRLDAQHISAKSQGSPDVQYMNESPNSQSTASRQKFRFPRITDRVWRSALVVLATAIIYEYLFQDRNPCFALIGAVYGVGSQFEEGFHNGFNRFIGTFVGGLLVIPFYTLYTNPLFGVPDWAWMVLGLCLVLLCNLALGADSAIQPGTVVYFVVMFTVGQERVVPYTIARIIDTGVGVLIALAITTVLPTKRDRENGLSFRSVFTHTGQAFQSYLHKNRKFREQEHENFGRKK